MLPRGDEEAGDIKGSEDQNDQSKDNNPPPKNFRAVDQYKSWAPVPKPSGALQFELINQPLGLGETCQPGRGRQVHWLGLVCSHHVFIASAEYRTAVLADSQVLTQ